MILVIPLINIRNGKCPQCISGEPGTEGHYAGLSEKPLDLVRLLRVENTRSIHVNDISPNESYSGYNLDSIIYLSQSVDIPIQVATHFEHVDQCRYLLNQGIYRIVISDLAIQDPTGIRELITEYTQSRIVFNVRAIDDKIYSKSTETYYDVKDYLKYIKKLGAQRVLFIKDKWLASETEYEEEDIIELFKGSQLRVTLFEGVNSAQKLLATNEMLQYGVDSVVIGKPLFDNNFPCQKLWRQMECKLDT